MPSKPPEPAAVVACRFAVVVHAASRRWLSSSRQQARVMKNIITIGVLSVSVFLAGCGQKDSNRSTSLSKATQEIKNDMQRTIAQSPVIAYASAITNNAPDILLSIDEIWKGAHEARELGITNGTQMPFRWPVDFGELPEGAIVFIPKYATASTLQQGPGSQFFTPSQKEGLTVQGYKVWIEKLANKQ